jgi:septum formation protein
MSNFPLHPFFSTHRVILCSSSKWRKYVLESQGLDFDIVSPDIDEKAIRSSNPEILAVKVANAKADECLIKLNKCATNDSIKSVKLDQRDDDLPKRPEKRNLLPSLIICSDQVAVFNEQIREKPQNKDEAEIYIRSYSNSKFPVKTVTSIVLVNSHTGRRIEAVDTAKVWYSEIPEEIIKKALDKGQVLSSAGGFLIDDGLLENYVKKIEGTRDSVMGLPVGVLSAMLEEMVNEEGGMESEGITKLRKIEN